MAESISEMESKKFKEGLKAKVNLSLYKTLGKGIEFIKYLHGVADARSCYLSLGQESVGLMKKWVGIGVGKVKKSVSCVKVLIMCCGSV